MRCLRPDCAPLSLCCCWYRCRQLMSEQEVQARAADAARANVESHYNYIASLYAAFVDK